MQGTLNLNADARLGERTSAGSQSCWRATFTPDYNKNLDESIYSFNNAWMQEYPWSGLFRALVAGYRYNLPHLADLALEKIKRQARR